MPNGKTLSLYSIFRSINGEINVSGQGSWATFIRFSGCNLNCSWCDTEYAKSSNKESSDHFNMTVPKILETVEHLKCSNVTVTGGEPLFQRKGLEELLEVLVRNRFKVSIETNGSYPIIPNMKVSWVVDYKLPSSGESHRMNVLDYWWYQLTPDDYIKFVIADRYDYDLALTVMQKLWSGGSLAQMLFSPLNRSDDKSNFINTLYRWMQENQLFAVGLNLQLHKLVNLDEPK